MCVSPIEGEPREGKDGEASMVDPEKQNAWRTVERPLTVSSKNRLHESMEEQVVGWRDVFMTASL